MRKYIFIVAVLLFALPAMSQNTFHVNTGSDSGVGSLRNAINSSNSGSGLDMIVFDGNFTVVLTSELQITKPVTITGNGVGLTVIDGGGTTRIFSINTAASGFSLNDLTIQNAKGLINSGGGAIASSGGVNIKNVRFYNNTASVSDASLVYGGAIYLTGANASVITMCTFESNKVIKLGGATGNGNGGAIGVNATGGLTLSDCSLDGNSATTSGGAIYSSSPVTINSSLFSGNKASYDANLSAYNGSKGVGGAIYATEALTLTGDLSFKSNVAMGGGGGIQKGSTGAFTTSGLTSFIFLNNISGSSTSSTGAGGAISTNANLTLTSANGVIMNDNICYGPGGAIWSYTSAALSLDGITQITNNSATAGGGAIWAGDALTLKNTTISGNRAGYNPDTKAYSLGGSGGGAIQAGAAITLIGDIVFQRDTTAGYGGALYWTAPSLTTPFDVSQLKSLLISECAAVAMSYSAGGAMYTKANINLTAPDSIIIRNNYALSSGGGMFMAASTTNTLARTSLRNNTSGGTGAGINHTGASLTINNSNIINNIAKGAGGGICAGTGSVLTLGDVIISGNKAGYDPSTSLFLGTLNNGGGVYALDALTLQGSIICNNNMTSSNGGGIWKYNIGAFTTNALTDITLDRNTAVGGVGGGIYSGVALSLKNATNFYNR